jgi:hypothetical protein
MIFAFWLIAGAVLFRVITFEMTPWMFGPSEDQMAAAIVPTVFGLAVGAKTYYWSRRRVINFWQSKREAETEDRRI